jgi:tetratricopeptide (TPR) repeat protein
MRWFSAVPLAFVIAAAAPAFADVEQHVNAARNAERRGEWQKALDEWKAAYTADGNAEYLIGIGDACSHLGNKDEARKNYQAYLADPLALPANVERVKIKIAVLASQPGGLALPSPGDATAASSGRGKKKGGDSAPPPLPGLDLPAQEQLLGLPGLDVPASSPPSKKEQKKIASASPGLDLPPLPLPAATKKEEKPAIASTALANKASTESKVAVATPPRTAPSERKVPDSAIAEVPAARPKAEASSGAARVVAWVSAGVAVAALGGGTLAFTKANSAHNDLTSKVHDSATAQSLLESEKQNRSLSFVGFAGGLVAAGIATALFAF